MLKTFYLAGFECATGYNRHHQKMDQIAATQHDRKVDEDYAMLREHGIEGVRDSVRWPLVDQGGKYDFSSLDPVIAAANKHDMTVVWDLFHYGFPDDVDLLSKAFPERFADYCGAAARYIAERTPGPHYFTPVNEPSYFSWAAGDAGLFAPHLSGRGYDLKVALAMAGIAGANAIFQACPDATIVQADPICHVVAPPDHPERQAEADAFNNEVVFQSLDMIAGKLHPELGGSPRHLGIVGLNYYWTNQWELGREGTPLADDDPRRLPLRDLVKKAAERYGQPVMITETAHAGEHRAAWIAETARESVAALDAGVPLVGVCLYPVLGMPEWHEPEKWARLGLWDCEGQGGELVRVPNAPALEALREAQHVVANHVGQPAEQPMVSATRPMLSGSQK